MRGLGRVHNSGHMLMLILNVCGCANSRIFKEIEYNSHSQDAQNRKGNFVVRLLKMT